MLVLDVNIGTLMAKKIGRYILNNKTFLKFREVNYDGIEEPTEDLVIDKSLYYDPLTRIWHVFLGIPAIEKEIELYSEYGDEVIFEYILNNCECNTEVLNNISMLGTDKQKERIIGYNISAANYRIARYGSVELQNILARTIDRNNITTMEYLAVYGELETKILLAQNSEVSEDTLQRMLRFAEPPLHEVLDRRLRQ